MYIEHRHFSQQRFGQHSFLFPGRPRGLSLPFIFFLSFIIFHLFYLYPTPPPFFRLQKYLLALTFTGPSAAENRRKTRHCRVFTNQPQAHLPYCCHPCISDFPMMPLNRAVHFRRVIIQQRYQKNSAV